MVSPRTERISLAKIAKHAKKNQRFEFNFSHLGDLGGLGESISG
jgi:hypothetical protein